MFISTAVPEFNYPPLSSGWSDFMKIEQQMQQAKQQAVE